ncbi:hypothetical protein PR202_gb18345 [Eleusine coracana subsp. coracana]|uniref:Uncharacterized protein n=1 Tax=Eleusine coracana subsp. coracana TaxID=191504 RepID=A0AAV5F5X4_ELECO|nr:hypothetical protein PR202_gb18345 [Eleusine coracana subsp. coracana]
MCRATTVEDVPHGAAAFLRHSRSLDIRAFYLRLSSSSNSPAAAPAELSLVYLPAIGGAALVLNGRALPPAAPAEVKLRQVAGESAAYASADRVAAAEGARFEVYAGKERSAEGVFVRRPGAGWRVECHRIGTAGVAEVVVLAEDGEMMRGKARSSRRGIGCGATRLEGIPEEATEVAWGCDCECGLCGEEWEVVLGDDKEDAETVRWAMEMGVWAVCLGVGLLATARRFRRKRAFW